MQAADTSKLYWAHPIANPEKGCVLIAHPLMFTTQQRYFAQVRALRSDKASGPCVCSTSTLAQALICGMSKYASMPLIGGGAIAVSHLHL